MTGRAKLYTKLQKYVSFALGSKSPLSPLFPKGGTLNTDRYAATTGELMRLLVRLRSPFVKGAQGDFFLPHIPLPIGTYLRP